MATLFSLNSHSPPIIDESVPSESSLRN